MLVGWAVMSAGTSGGIGQLCSSLLTVRFAVTQDPQAKWLRVGKTAKSGFVETIWQGCKPKLRPYPGFPELPHPGCGLISCSYLMFDMRANPPSGWEDSWELRRACC